MRKYLIVLAALPLAMAGPVRGEPEAAEPPGITAGEIQWWSAENGDATVKIRGEEGTTIRIGLAGAYGCEMSFLAEGNQPGLVLYRTPGGIQVVTLQPPAPWLEDGEAQTLSLVTVAADGLKLMQAQFKRVADPNRGQVLRTQAIDPVSPNLKGALALIVGASSEDRDPLDFSLSDGQANAALDVMDSCLAWSAAHPPKENPAG